MKIKFNFRHSIILGLFLAVLGFSVNSLGQPKIAKSAPGQQNIFGLTEVGKYDNSYFGFKFHFPESYTVVQSEEAKVYSKAGADILRGGGQQNSKRFDEALARQATIIGILQKPYGLPQNAIIEIVAAKQAKGVTANIALAASTSLMTTSTGYKLTKSLDNATFGRKRFAGARLDGEFNSVKLTQETYVIMRREYAIYIAVTYSTDEGRKNMIAILDSLEFAN